jgi:hypothetical protein
VPEAILAQNQVNRLPMITATDAAAPDVVTFVGQKAVKLWLPATLGINGTNYVGDPDDAAGSMLLSSYLDVRGCNEFLALLVCNVPNIGSTEGAVAQSLMLQYRTVVPSIAPHSGNIGTTLFSSGAGRVPTMSTFPDTFIMSFGWANPGGAVTLSKDMRLWFRRTIGARGQQTYTCYLWGQGS